MRTATIRFVMSVRLEQLVSQQMDFHEIGYLNSFRKSVQKIQISLKSARNNGYFTRTPIYIYDISLFSTENKKCFGQCFRENKNTHFTFRNVWTENRVVYDIMSKNAVDLERLQMRSACCITNNADNTLRICNNYCFSTATTVTRERLNVTLYVHSLSFLFISSSPISSNTRLYHVFFLARQPPVGQGLLIHEVSRSHTTTHHSR